MGLLGNGALYRELSHCQAGGSPALTYRSVAAVFRSLRFIYNDTYAQEQPTLGT